MNVWDSNLLPFVYKFCLLKQLPVVAGDAGNLSLSLSCRSAACKHAGLYHIHSPLFNNLSVLPFILEHSSLHCTASVPSEGQTETERERKRRKKKAACVSWPTHHRYHHSPSSCFSTWPRLPVNLLFLFCQPRAAALSTALLWLFLPSLHMHG